MATSGGGEEVYFLELDSNPVRFEPVSKVTNVFFDEANRQVFVVRSGGAMGVVVKGPDEKTSTDFRMEDKGDVISIKFSPDQKILAIQRCQKSVEFVNYSDTIDVIEYSQCCKGKNTKILGFVWTTANEIVFITDHGIELYQVFSEKRILKSIKTHSMAINWFVYHPETSLLVVSSGALGNILHSFQFRPSAFYRLPKFEVDLPVIPKPVKLCLFERDVTVGNIYNKTCIIVLRHQVRSGGNAGAEIVLYTLQKDGPPRKTDILRLDMSGRFAINLLDDLVVVHHQSTKSSVLFDIKLPGESDGYLTYHRPIVEQYTIKPFKLQVSVVLSQAGVELPDTFSELYSPNWVIFQPDIIIDAKLGYLWVIRLNLEPLSSMISDKYMLILFLLMRCKSKDVILKVCRSAVTVDSQLSLLTLSKIFDRLNEVFRQSINLRTSQLESASPQAPGKQCAVIDQSDMYTHVFSVFEERNFDDFHFIVAVLLEYIRSLTQHQIVVQHYLYELLINTMVQQKCFYQLHQFLQYHIFSDSKPLACLMLSLQNLYPAANQLALDMLKRLGKASDEIVEVLLSQQQVLPAIRYIRTVGNIETISARKFLEAAQNSKDPDIYYSVFKFFELRNLRQRGSSSFIPTDHCELYIKHFELLFGSSTSLPKYITKNET